MGVSIELKGDESAVLAMYAEEIESILSTIPEIKDIETSLETGEEEVHLTVDRKKTEKFRISPQLVARTVAAALSTRAVTRYKSDEGEIDVVLQLQGEDQLSLQELQNIQFENRDGEMIPLYAVVDYRYEKGPLSIRRDDRKGVLQITANAERGGGMFLNQMIQDGWRANFSFRQVIPLALADSGCVFRKVSSRAFLPSFWLSSSCT